MNRCSSTLPAAQPSPLGAVSSAGVPHGYGSAPASGHFSVCALSFGRALVLSRPKKPHWGFFPRSFMPTAPAAAGVSGSAPAPRLGRGGTPRLLRLLLRARPSLGKGCASVRPSRPCLAAPSRATRRCLASLPAASPFCRSRSAAGGSRGRPCGVSRSGGCVPHPPPSFSAAPWAALFSSFPVGGCSVFAFRAAAQGSPPPARLKAGAVLCVMPCRSPVSFRHIVNYRHGVGGLGVFS